MGNILSSSPDPEIVSHVGLAKAHINQKNNIRYILNEIRIRKNFITSNSSVREQKEIATINRGISKTMVEVKEIVKKLN